MTPEQEKKWREEAKTVAENSGAAKPYHDLITNGYLAARKDAQVEIDEQTYLHNTFKEAAIDAANEITALKQQLQEREDLIKELIDTFDLFDEVPLPFKIVNKMESVVKKARKILGEG